MQGVSFGRMLRQDMRRATLSAPFFISGAAITALMYWLAHVWPSNDVLNVFGFAFSGNASDKLVVCMFPCMAYSYSYIVDNKSKAVRYWSVRSGIWRYSASKFLSAALSGMLVYVLAMALVVGLLLLEMPLSGYSVGWQNGYTCMLTEYGMSGTGESIVYLACHILHYGLTVAMFSGMAFCATAIVPNVFVAFLAPVVIDLVYLRVCKFIELPMWLEQLYLVQLIYDMGSPAGTLFTKIGTVAAILAVLGVVSCIFIRRRFINE